MDCVHPSCECARAAGIPYPAHTPREQHGRVHLHARRIGPRVQAPGRQLPFQEEVQAALEHLGRLETLLVQLGPRVPRKQDPAFKYTTLHVTRTHVGACLLGPQRRRHLPTVPAAPRFGQRERAQHGAQPRLPHPTTLGRFDPPVPAAALAAFLQVKDPAVERRLVLRAPLDVHDPCIQTQ